MARTRNTVSKAARLLRSGRQVDSAGSNPTAAGSSISNKKKKSGNPEKSKGKSHFSEGEGVHQLDGTANDEAGTEDSSNGEGDREDSDVVDSEDDESENYYPTKIAKKREAEKAHDGDGISRAAHGMQRANIKVTNKAPQPSKHSKTSKSSTPTGELGKTPCIACSNAHCKCEQTAGSGQPCERCERMRLKCVVDPNHKRSRDLVSRGNIARGTKTAAALEFAEKDCSDDPLNSPAPPNRLASRNTTARPSTHASSSSATRPNKIQYSSSSSSLSSPPESSSDELDITMTGTKKANKKKQGVSTTTPNPSSKRRLTRAAARKGPAQGISPITKTDQQQHGSSSSNLLRQTKPMDSIQPEQIIALTDLTVHAGNTTKPQKGKGKDRVGPAKQHKNTPSDASPIDQIASPDPTVLPTQHNKQSESAVADEVKSTPTFIPKGHGSILNPDSEDAEPLPPISELGQGGAYIGRYDSHHATELITSSTDTWAPTVQAPPTTTSYDMTTGSHPSSSPVLPQTAQNALVNDMPAEGTPAYRYSATKILFLLKHGQRAQLLALGGAHIAPETVAQLNVEVGDARRRAIALWHEVHSNGPAGGTMYDAGGLAFLMGMGP
ncbi:hypothetical protein N0V93_004029 [Gnomoniopsis smithogilvyi]|uniref:Zn(2)-C6 fungal-type domain-containing protein n=1 Tax=Gnomoniopsis smithogilvyi TaxID=1191159 RepID=A0A9W8YZK1_9PEZI|nr:hypothetical protein N0V93_004029 [Gnomoniopsis smithogilvyi]